MWVARRCVSFYFRMGNVNDDAVFCVLYIQIRRKPSLKSASWRTSSWNWTTRADERVWAPGTSGPRYGRCTRHSWTRWELVRYRASAADR